MFEKDTGLTWDEIDFPHIDLQLNMWEDGVLTTFTYKKAWGNYWNKIDEATKEQFKALPNFDAEIFKEITGIEIEGEVKIEVEGKIVYISRESAIALNLIKG